MNTRATARNTFWWYALAAIVIAIYLALLTLKGCI